jgi:SIR2-like protein
MSATEHVIVPIPSSETPANGADSVHASQESSRILNWIAERVAAHECILFLGSAIHVPSPVKSKYHYTKEKCPPIGIELSKQLAAQCGYKAEGWCWNPKDKCGYREQRGESGDALHVWCANRSDQCGYKGDDWWNLQRVSQFFETKMRSRYMLVNAIHRAVQLNKEPSPVLHGLANLDFPIVITTNYDDLYEKALRQERANGNSGGKLSVPYDLSVYSPKPHVKTQDCPAKPDALKPYVLKIHGDIGKPESIVITEEDYIQFILRMSDRHPHHPVGKNVLTYLNKWPTLFIGYRLTDYNLRLLFKTLRWTVDAANIPPTYSVDIDPDVLIRDVYESQKRYITFIVEDLWDFVPKLYEAVKGKEMPQ